MYTIIVGAVFLFCLLLAIAGGIFFFVQVGAFLWLVVTKQWDRHPHEYGTPIRQVVFKGQSLG